jgi:hypothetical protein
MSGPDDTDQPASQPVRRSYLVLTYGPAWVLALAGVVLVVRGLAQPSGSGVLVLGAVLLVAAGLMPRIRTFETSAFPPKCKATLDALPLRGGAVRAA